jgi:hypothetical protein
VGHRTADTVLAFIVLLSDKHNDCPSYQAHPVDRR